MMFQDGDVLKITCIPGTTLMEKNGGQEWRANVIGQQIVDCQLDISFSGVTKWLKDSLLYLGVRSNLSGWQSVSVLRGTSWYTLQEFISLPRPVCVA